MESRGVHGFLRDELLHSVQVVDYLRERIRQTSLSAVRTLRRQPTIVTNICSHTFPWLVYKGNRLPLQAVYDTNTKRHFHHRRPFSYPGALKMTYAKNKNHVSIRVAERLLLRNAGCDVDKLESPVSLAQTKKSCYCWWSKNRLSACKRWSKKRRCNLLHEQFTVKHCNSEIFASGVAVRLSIV